MYFAPDGEGEAMVLTKFMIIFDHVPVWKQIQKLADEATVPYGIINCFEISKHITGLFSAKNSLQCPVSKSDLIYG